MFNHGGGGGGGGAAKVSLNGNTSGTLTLISTGTLYLGGGANITLSQDGNSITISGGVNPGATTFLAGVQNLGNTSGATGTVNNQIIFAGGNNITLSESRNAQSATVTISGPNVFSAGVSTGGNTLGTTGTVSNQVLFVGGNNITLSQSSAAGGATITISGPAVGGAQTGISSVSVSDTVYTSGGVSFVGSGIITAKSGVGQQVILDATTTQSVQTQDRFNLTISGNTSGALAAISSGSMTLVGGNNITLSQAGNAITISGPNAGGAQTGISGIAGSAASTVTAGTVQWANANNISFGLNGSTMTASYSQSLQPAQTGISGVSASDTVYTSGTVKWTGSNIITVRSGAGQAVVIDATVPAQSIQTQNSVLVNGSSGALSFNAGAMMSLSTVASNLTFINLVSSATAIQEVSSATAAGAMVSRFANEGHVHAGVGPAGISNIGNTLGDTGAKFGRIVFAGGTNITLSASSSNNNAQTITIIGASGGGAGYTAGLSTGGNTSGDATNVTGRLIFAGGNNITLSGSTNAGSMTITVSGPTGGGAGISTFGNTAGTTGIADNQLVLVGSQNITLSQSVNGGSATVTILGPSAVAGMSAGISGGNTSGDTGSVTGRVLFAGGNNVTLSGSTNGGSMTITISGANVGGAQTGISSISVSDTVYTSGQVKFTGSNIVTVKSGTGQAVIIDATVPAQTAESNTLGISNLGNTSGTSGVASGNQVRILFAGGNNITLSQSLDGSSATITISGANVGGAQTGISGISASDTLYTSGSVRFTGSNNITVASGTGQLVIISGPTGGGAGMSTQGNTAGTTGTVGKELILVGGNNITLSQSVNGSSATLTIIAGGGGGGIAASIGGNSTSAGAGYSNVTSGTLLLAGGNNITLSQNGASVTISGPNVGGAQTGISSIVASDATYTSGQVIFTGAGAATIVSGANQSVIVSVPVHVNQTGISGIAGSAASTVTAGTVQFANSNGVSFGLNGSTMTASHNAITSQSNQVLTVYATSNTVSSSSGTINASSVILRGIDGLSVGVSNGSLLFEAGDNDVGVHNIGMSNLGNTSGTSGVVSATQFQFLFAGGNNITLSQSINGSSGTITISGAAQSVQPEGTVQIGLTGATNGGFATGTTGYASGTSPRYAIYAGANIALGQSLDAASVSGSLTIQAAPSGVATLGMSNIGNTSGTSGVVTNSSPRLVFAGGNNITLSQFLNAGSDAGTITIIGGAGGAFAAGVSSGGNTSGDTKTIGGQLVFAGGTNITLSQSTNGVSATITISGPTGGGAGMGTGTNTSGTSGTVGKQLYIYGNSNIGLSQSIDGASASLTIIGGGGGAAITLSSYEPYGAFVGGANTGVTNVLQLLSNTSGIVYLFPMTIEEHVKAEYMNLVMQHSFTTNGNSSGQQSGQFNYGLYTRQTGASSTVLSLATSSYYSWAVTGNNSSYTLSYPVSTDTAGFTYSTTASAGLNVSSKFTGAKLLVLPMTYMLTPGMYWLGVVQTVSTSSVNVGLTQSLFGFNQGTTLQNLPPFGMQSSLYSAGSNAMDQLGGQWLLGHGSWATGNGTGLPNSMGLQSVTGGAVSHIPYVNFWCKA